MSQKFQISKIDSVINPIDTISSSVSELSDQVSNLYDQNIGLSADIAELNQEQCRQFDRIYSLQLFRDSISERFILENEELIRESSTRAKYILSFSTFSVCVYHKLSWFRRLLLKICLGCKIRKVEYS